MKIAIIVDHLDASMRRRCFWDEVLRTFSECQYELVSLLDKMVHRTFFDVYAYDVIIFNWCVLDGSVMYDSDRTRSIVAFYEYHFMSFVREGGVLIFENQPKRWQPNQDAYDTLLRGELKVLKTAVPLFYAPHSDKARINPAQKEHPLVRNLPDVLHSAYPYPHDQSWFPSDSTSKRSLQELHPTKLYSGSFRTWKASWIPLIYDEDLEHAIMLVRMDGDGLWIATTMFIAASNNRTLIENLLGACRRRDAIQRYHDSYRRRQRRQTSLALGGLGLVAAGIYVALRFNVVALAFIPVAFTSTIAGNVVLSLSITFSVWILGKFIKFLNTHLRTAFGRR